MSDDILAGVSRETVARLEAFAARLLHWDRAINLIGGSTRAEVWQRHILDSAQLWPLAPAGARRWLDLGSGGGLPGIVVAIIAAEPAPGLRVVLVESDRRKAAFLADAIHRFGLNAEVLARRAERLAEDGGVPPADIVSARALAPLDRLLALARPLARPRATLLLPKGRRANSELTAARRSWHIEHEAVSSRTDPEATILIIREFHPRHDI